MTNQLIIETISQTMGLTTIGENQLERSHHVGRKRTSKDDRESAR